MRKLKKVILAGPVGTNVFYQIDSQLWVKIIDRIWRQIGVDIADQTHHHIRDKLNEKT